MKKSVWKPFWQRASRAITVFNLACCTLLATYGSAMAQPLTISIDASDASVAESPSIGQVAIGQVAAAEEPVVVAQVNTISELSDVQYGDWAYTALQRLIEEYGCLDGYPNRLFRGDRTLTRYEFAAGLNACLDTVIQLVGGGGPNLNELGRLEDEFADELAAIRSQVDGLESRAAEFNAQQFSTTTRLSGNLDAHLVIPFSDTVAIADGVISQDPAAAPNATDSVVGGDEADATFEYWSRLNLNTSFTGEDSLFISMSAADSAGSLANSESGLNYTSGQMDSNVALDDVYYSFPVGDRIQAKIAANSVLPEDFVSSVVVPFGDSAIAAAGLPEFYVLYPAGDFGAGTNINLSDNLVLDLAYLSDASNENRGEQGLFNDYSYIAQLNLLTNGPLEAAVVYLDGDQQTTLVNEGALMEAISSQVKPDYTLAGLVSLDLGQLVLAGHYAHTPANGVEGDLHSYMGGVSFPGLFGENNELGVYGGISPAINRDPLLVEAYYRLNVNEFFTFTPALIYTDSDSNVGPDDNFYGALRATFSF